MNGFDEPDKVCQPFKRSLDKICASGAAKEHAFWQEFKQYGNGIVDRLRTVLRHVPRAARMVTHRRQKPTPDCH